MRSSAFLSSSSGPLTSSTAVFIGRTPEPPAGVSLSYCVIRGARNLSRCRVFRRRSKRQSVMERFAKAKFGAAGLVWRYKGYPGIVYFRDIFVRELEGSGACRNNMRLRAATTPQDPPQGRWRKLVSQEGLLLERDKQGGWAEGQSAIQRGDDPDGAAQAQKDQLHPQASGRGPGPGRGRNPGRGRRFRPDGRR